MAKYNKANGNTKSIGVIIITAVFAILGIICIIIGYKDEVLTWLSTFGIVLLVIASPILVYIIYQLVLKKIKDM